MGGFHSAGTDEYSPSTAFSSDESFNPIDMTPAVDHHGCCIGRSFDLDDIAEIFGFVASAICYFLKVGDTIHMPNVPWPAWIHRLSDFFSGLIEAILSFLSTLPEIDQQTSVVLNGVVPFVLFPILWRYFRHNMAWPGLYLLLHLFPALFFGLFGLCISMIAFSPRTPLARWSALCSSVSCS
jgi:hypothetical protein